jgi:hypothetical protein
VEELHALLAKIVRRLMRLLTRRGLLIEEHGPSTSWPPSRPIRRSPPCRWPPAPTVLRSRPRAGHKVLSLQSLSPPSEPASPALCAKAHGFSLHAATRCAADQRNELEQLCRYITRPAIANARLSCNRAGEVALRLKTPYQDGTTHIVMSPLEFLQRLAALVPRPRLHLIRFHGVLAAHAKLRAAVVPRTADTNAHVCNNHADPAPSRARMNWARLLQRVFAIDIEHCPHCGGALKILAAIEDPTAIVAILTHLDLPARAPPRSSARALPLFRAA